MIITDLDETLRMANVENKVKAGVLLIKGVKPYEGMQYLFDDLKKQNNEISFHYLSNSYKFLYDAQKWVNKYQFPAGQTYQRGLRDSSKTFKPKKLRSIIAKHPGARFIFFGDNVEHDPVFYQELVKEMQADAEIYIRDARLVFPQESGITFYQHERQIADDLRLSQENTLAIESLPFSKLVPSFLFTNLRKRILKACRDTKERCQEIARERIEDITAEIKPI